MQAQPVPLEAHARWRYLLSADGQAASWRLAKLLAMNSLTLRYRSDEVEYYYRSLSRGEHFVEVTERDLIPTLEALQGQQEKVQRIVAQAQRFAYRYLSSHSRVAYGAAALRAYKDLFVDMDALLAKLPDSWTLDDLLAMRTSDTYASFNSRSR